MQNVIFSFQGSQCNCTCKDGKDGKDGRDGKDGVVTAKQYKGIFSVHLFLRCMILLFSGY